MTNNEILRRIRYIFDFSDTKMLSIFGLADCAITRRTLDAWLRKDDDPLCQKCIDPELATFLNGLIILNRGRKDGALPEPEQTLGNNIIFRKLRIALKLRDEDILKVLDLVNLPISKHELSAFFRRPDHKHYRPCRDQILRNFLNGLGVQHRGRGGSRPLGEDVV